jgi:DNA-binding NtrC family response regulator
VRELKNVVERVILKANGEMVRPADLPSDIFGAPARGASRTASGLVSGSGEPSHDALPSTSVVDELTARMVDNGESFWSAVYPIFMSRDLLRADLRKIVQHGLEATNGNYRRLTRLFNMPDDDYKRFLNFLRKHECQVPFQVFRLQSAAQPQGNPVTP